MDWFSLDTSDVNKIIFVNICGIFFLMHWGAGKVKKLAASKLKLKEVC